MKYCGKCGNKDEAKFCGECGSKFEETLLFEQKDTSEQKENTKGDGKFSWLKSLTLANMAKNAKSAVVLAICLTCGFYAVSGIVSGGEGLRSILHWVQDGFSKKEANIVNVIIKEKRGIQEVAVAKADYTIEKNLYCTQGMLIFDYITKKFICDFHYTVKYGYDLSTLTDNDITVNKLEKTVKIKLPKGMLISNELVKTNIRHNEGILGDWNKVKAEDIDALQTEAKMEVIKQAESDSALNKLAKENIKLAFEKSIQGVAPDYSVIVVDE